MTYVACAIPSVPDHYKRESFVTLKAMIENLKRVSLFSASSVVSAIGSEFEFIFFQKLPNAISSDHRTRKQESRKVTSKVSYRTFYLQK